MKYTKTVLCSILSMLIIAGAAVFPTSATSIKTTDKTMSKYTKINLSAAKSTKDTYNYKIENNKKKYVNIEFKDNGSRYKLNVIGKKVTKDKKKPLITVYKEKNGKKTDVKKYRITVNVVQKQKFEDKKINVKMSKKVTLNNPFIKEYSFKYDKKIISIKKVKSKGTKRTYRIKTHKEGSTDVEVRLKDKTKLIGKFKVTAGDVKTEIKKKYKPLKLKYNAHGSSTYMKDCHISLDSMLKNKKYNATYTVTIDSENIASTYIDKNNTFIYSTGKGSTTAELYQKIGKKPEEKIGEFKINVEKSKMNYVAKQNMLYFPDGIFGNGEFVEYLSPNETFNMKTTIVNSLINNKETGSHFKASCYSISFKSTDTSVVKVTSAGKVTAKKLGYAIINYSIGFSDNSVFKGGCPVEVIKN